jgi:hypothetical protein
VDIDRHPYKLSLSPTSTPIHHPARRTITPAAVLVVPSMSDAISQTRISHIANNTDILFRTLTDRYVVTNVWVEESTLQRRLLPLEVGWQDGCDRLQVATDCGMISSGDGEPTERRQRLREVDTVCKEDQEDIDFILAAIKLYDWGTKNGFYAFAKQIAQMVSEFSHDILQGKQWVIIVELTYDSRRRPLLYLHLAGYATSERFIGSTSQALMHTSPHSTLGSGLIAQLLRTPRGVRKARTTGPFPPGLICSGPDGAQQGIQSESGNERVRGRVSSRGRKRKNLRGL